MFLGRSIGKRQRRNIYTRTDIQSVDSHHSLKVGVMKLSIRWLAIDSFDHKTFSEKSDIWSFAVTMWEIFTNGLQPYAGTPPVLSFYPCVQAYILVRVMTVLYPACVATQCQALDCRTCCAWFEPARGWSARRGVHSRSLT